MAFARADFRYSSGEKRKQSSEKKAGKRSLFLLQMGVSEDFIIQTSLSSSTVNRFRAKY